MSEIPEYEDIMKYFRREIPKSEIHLGHAEHLCNLVNQGIDLEDYRKLVKNPKFLCKKCGRTAELEKNLCEPTPL